MRKHIAFILIILASLKVQAAGSDSSPTFELSGDVGLTSHYVEHGISQTDKSPALQGSFWFNFGPQFRLGLWGSNTNYPSGNDHFNLRYNAEIIVPFSTNSHLDIKFGRSTYYSDGTRNGDLSAAHLQIGEYKVAFDQTSNWEGTKNSSKRYSFGKVFSISGSWKWTTEIGYNTPSVSTMKAYFDGRTGIGSKFGVIFLEGSITGTSASSDLNGAGDVFAILSARTDL